MLGSLLVPKPKVSDMPILLSALQMLGSGLHTVALDLILIYN